MSGQRMWNANEINEFQFQYANIPILWISHSKFEFIEIQIVATTHFNLILSRINENLQLKFACTPKFILQSTNDRMALPELGSNHLFESFSCELNLNCKRIFGFAIPEFPSNIPIDVHLRFWKLDLSTIRLWVMQIQHDCVIWFNRKMEIYLGSSLQMHKKLTKSIRFEIFLSIFASRLWW